jgi:septum site-determining protein MinD
MIPEDKLVIDSTNKGELLVNLANGSLASKAFENISRRIEGEDIPFINFNPQGKGIFGLFRRKR